MSLWLMNQFRGIRQRDVISTIDRSSLATAVNFFQTVLVALTEKYHVVFNEKPLQKYIIEVYR